MTDASSPPATRTSPGAGPTLWIGLLVVLVAAAALSFGALHHLAVAVSMPPRLAPLLPIAIDAGAAVSCATWLSHRVDQATALFARRTTYWLLALTVVGNAAQLGMHANDLTPPWWVAVAVGAVPPGTVGATVHLIVLVPRFRQPDVGDHNTTTRTTIDDGVWQRAERLVAEGARTATRRRRAGLTDHQARRLVEDIRRPSPVRPHRDHTVVSPLRRDDHANDRPGPYSSSDGGGPEPPAAGERE